MKRWWILGAIVALLVLSGGVLNREKRLVAGEPISAWTEDHKADCGVVLTGGPGRVREGFDLLAQGQIHKLIISGVNPRATLREIFPQWPYYGELRAEDVVLERRSGTTYGNAQQSLPLVEAMRCRSLVLITSHLHMRRAYRTFRQVYPPEILILTRGVSSGVIPPRSQDLTSEVLKSLFYSLWAY
ncbi:MAG TPA: YdcF family protein [Bdellovibrionales bacterium]|nr:YdcF family protein [Bdellovibrionales bacterium]